MRKKASKLSELQLAIKQVPLDELYDFFRHFVIDTNKQLD